MKQALLLLVALSLSGCGFFKLNTPRVKPEPPKIDVVARAVNNTVSLSDKDGVFCSGVAAEGVVFTAHHCIDGEESFVVNYRGTAYRPVVALDWIEEDLAVLQLVGKRLRDTIPLSPEAPVLGQKVIWLGYPLGVQLIMGIGIVGNPLDDTGSMAVYGQFIPGNSGGPVLDETGKLLGIVVRTMALPGIPFPQYLPVGYAVHWEHLNTALDAL